jgi:hypothetical protein
MLQMPLFYALIVYMHTIFVPVIRVWPWMEQQPASDTICQGVLMAFDTSTS